MARLATALIETPPISGDIALSHSSRNFSPDIPLRAWPACRARRSRTSGKYSSTSYRISSRQSPLVGGVVAGGEVAVASLAPQLEQKFPAAGTPQFEQYIGILL